MKESYTVFEAPFPRISLYCVNKPKKPDSKLEIHKEKMDHKIEKRKKVMRKRAITLPYLLVGSTSTNSSELSSSESATPFIPFPYR